MIGNILGYLDYIIIGLLVLGFLFGFFKGFKDFKKVYLSFPLGLAAGFFACGPLARLIVNIGSIYDHPLFNYYFSLVPNTEAFTSSLAGSEYANSISLIENGMNEMEIPKWSFGAIESHITISSETVGEAIASSFYNLTMIAILFVSIFLIVGLLSKKILKSVKENAGEDAGKSFTGRFLAGINFDINLSFIIIVLFTILLFVNYALLGKDLNSLDTFLVNDLNLAEGSYFSIGRIFYDVAVSIFRLIVGAF
ncbi:MAG: hypothetical protein WCR67_04020 [Bacilli bacterium]